MTCEKSPYRKYTEHFADGTTKDITEEIPFSIPENWAWCRLGEISSKITDGSHNPPPNRYSGIPMLSATNIFDDKINYDTSSRWVLEEEWEFENKRTEIEIDDVLLTIVGTIGRTAVVKSDKKFALQRSVAVIKPVMVNSEYIHYMLQTDFLYNTMINNSKGTAQKGIYLASLKGLFFPLPPLAEQKRIVAKVEELLVLVEELETNKTDLRSTIQQTKTKVLDMAIRGELVPQNPDDEPASVLLERIKNEQQSAKSKKRNTAHNTHYDNDKLLMVNDEFPFEIPENWAWCRLGEIGEVIMGQSPKSENISGKGNLEFHQGKIFFTSKYIKPSNFYTNEITKVAPANSVLICVRAPVGEVNITNRRLCIGRGLCCIVPLQRMSEKFIYYWTKTLKRKFIQKATGSTFSSISMDVIKNEIVPLPPLSEQKRIVQKIEEIFTELDTIEENLT
ncbi:restriction endonuclease subunit S [Capnocytophaga canimorsus]|uniref:restriction endonuclease subunit S n=1 Tax=Capnocytophaga canimorsus TaxID=28188 RepID=UPI00293712FF|nr:restriction endonuclease subunit S [Capnocytophaga canimorsus]